MLPGSTALLCSGIMLCSSSGNLLRHVIPHQQVNEKSEDR
jgi:hypothetical protein